MANGIRTPEEGWRTYGLKRCENNNKDEDNIPKTLNDKNHQASSQKFRQDRDTFKFNFYFRGLRLFCRVECLSEPVEIIVLSGQGVREILGIILANYKSLASSIGCLRIRRVYL